MEYCLLLIKEWKIPSITLSQMLAEGSPNRRLGVKANFLSSISCTEYILYQNQLFFVVISIH